MQRGERGFELMGDAQGFKLAVEHRAGGIMHPRAPAVVFAFERPVAGLGQRFRQRPAVDRRAG